MPRLNQRFGPRPSEVGARIRAERERRGLSQDEAAALLGVARGTYRQYEATANPQASTLIAFVEILGFDLARIYPELMRPRTREALASPSRSSARSADRQRSNKIE